MSSCWSENQNDRPTFTELRSKFDAMLSERNPYYFDLNHVNSQRPYYNSLGEGDENRTGSLRDPETEVGLDICIL